MNKFMGKILKKTPKNEPNLHQIRPKLVGKLINEVKIGQNHQKLTKWTKSGTETNKTFFKMCHNRWISTKINTKTRNEFNTKPKKLKQNCNKMAEIWWQEPKFQQNQKKTIKKR